MHSITQHWKALAHNCTCEMTLRSKSCGEPREGKQRVRDQCSCCSESCVFRWLGGGGGWLPLAFGLVRAQLCVHAAAVSGLKAKQEPKRIMLHSRRQPVTCTNACMHVYMCACVCVCV